MINAIKAYEVTGTINGKRFSYPTYDYEIAIKIFQANGLKSLWQIENGKRILLKRLEK